VNKLTEATSQRGWPTAISQSLYLQNAFFIWMQKMKHAY